MSGLKILALICTLFFPIKSERGFDYCYIKCINGTQTVQHIVCDRQNQCSLPAIGCFNFQNSSLTSTEREMILDEHNHLRNMVALGETEFSIKNITASNMNELKWNDELEYIALCLVNTCWEYWKSIQICLDTKNGKSGRNIAYKRISVDTHELGSPAKLKEHIYGWYSEIEKLTENNVDAFLTHDSGKVKHVSQMIWAKTTSVGCSRSIYGQYITMFACIYSPAGNINENPIFVKGPTCSGCEYGPCSETYKGLCRVLENKKTFQNILSNPATLAQKLIEVTTKPTEKTTFFMDYKNIHINDADFGINDVPRMDLSSEETLTIYDDDDSSTMSSIGEPVGVFAENDATGCTNWINGQEFVKNVYDFAVVVFVVMRSLCIL